KFHVKPHLVIGYVSPRHKVFLLWSEETTLAGWPRSPGGAALGGPAASELLTAQRLRLSHLDCRWLLTLFVAPHLELFLDQVLERVVPMRELGIHPLVLAELPLELLQPLQLRRLQPAVLRLPAVVGRRADPVLPPDLFTGTPASASFRIETICVSV